MKQLPVSLLIAAAVLAAAPALGTCPSNPASVVCTGTPIAISDAAYDGTTPSMACATCTYTIDPGCADALKTPPAFDIAVTHTWVGDLTIKVVSPLGTIKTLMSRPGGVETVDGVGYCCGVDEEWVGASVNFETGMAFPPGESLGTFVADVCSGDGMCDFEPDCGACLGEDATITDYLLEAPSGIWLVCVGDGAGGDIGTLDSAVIRFEQVLPVELQSFSVE